MSTDTGARDRGRKGERSRRAILLAAADLATVDGLEGLSIGRLAGHLGMSKSGVYAHFSSKEELQIATVGMAHEVFTREVVEPVAHVQDPFGHLRALYAGFLDHIGRRVFAGGCFYASVMPEFGAHPGPVQDRLCADQDEWGALVQGLLADARAAGLLAAGEDPVLLQFELDGFVLRGNIDFILRDDPVHLERARAVIARRLDRASAG